MDNIERQSKLDSLHGSLEKTMKAKFKKSVKERGKSIDLGICGPYLALSAIAFVHRRMYHSYFAPDAQWTFPSTDARR